MRRIKISYQTISGTNFEAKPATRLSAVSRVFFSFPCKIHPSSWLTEEASSLQNGALAMGKKTVIETQIGNTLYIVTSQCSLTATETIEKKLERLICNAFTVQKVIRRYVIYSLMSPRIRANMVRVPYKGGTDSCTPRKLNRPK
jgi:hypothetical protein